MTASLNELADRVEAAAGPDRELDNAIVDAFGWRNDFGVPIPHGCVGLPSYTGSVDDAMTLVPEGHAFSLHVEADGSVFAGCMPDDGDGCDDARRCGATPALALTAAALRSLASRGGGDG